MNFSRFLIKYERRIGQGICIATLFGVAAITFIVPACSKSNPPVTWNGVTMSNDCYIAAIQACTQLKGSGANERVLLIKYSMNGTIYGHAEAVFDWPVKPNPASVTYAFDENHGSFPIPQRIDATDALAVGKFCVPSTVVSYWADPSATPTTK